ncbi:FtsX-like permease family protein [Peptoniphilus catoniae]|uniref:FtsX-like permease family protein n=1 Tax=Peptoniphilus catoniae TaxID=1660341 RepID=UPI0010FD9EE6|nr:FtsX-like permease family protein [Peptoniphilus catoniae]
MSLLNKDTLREIKRSISRFISILVIVGLGVFIFTGLISTGTIMRDTVEKNIISQNYEDISVSATAGFEGEDIFIIESQKNIKELEYGYDMDLSVKDSILLLNVMNMPYKISKPTIIEGREPERGEIILDWVLKDRGYKLGDTVEFNKEVNKFSTLDEEEEDKLTNYRYKVVGFFKSVQDPMRDLRGQSLRGLGEIKGRAYIDESNFNMDPTIARIIYKDTQGLRTYTDEYKDLIEEHRKSLDLDFKHRPERRFISLKSEIEDEIKSGEDKISDAKDELSEGEEKLSDARDELAKGKKDYNKGLSDFNSEKAKSRSKLDEAKDKLYKSEKDIDDAQKELSEGYDKLKDGRDELDKSKAKLETGQAEYDQGKSEYDKGKAKLDASKTQLEEGEKQLAQGREELDKGYKTLEESKKKIEDGKAEIAENERKLEKGQEEIKSATEKIASGLGMPGSSIDDLEAKVYELLGQVNQAEELLSKYKLLEDTITKLESGISEIEGAKAQLEGAIALKQAELSNPNLSPEEKAAIEAEIEAYKSQLTGLEAKLEEAQAGLKEAQSQKQSMDLILSNLPDEMKDPSTIKGYKAKLEEAQAGIKEIKKSSSELEVGKAKLDSAKEQMSEGEKQLEEGIKKAQEGEEKYRENEKKLLEGRQEYEDGKIKLEDTKKQLADADSKLAKGKEDYEEGEKKYQESYKEYLEGRSKLDTGKAKYTMGKETLEESEKTFNEEIEKGEKKLADAKKDLYKGEKELADAEVEYADKSKEAEEKIKDAEEKLSDGRRIMRILKQPVYSITPRHLNFGINNYFDFAGRMDMLSFIFPLFFFMIALLVSFTTMTRMVDEQRILIGTYKALGYGNKEIAGKFFIYGALASIVGGILGAFAGSYVLPKIIGNAYFIGSVFESNLAFRFFPLRMILAIITGLIFTAVAAWLSVNKLLKENTANLLRVKPPKSGNRIFLERISPLWNKMTFLHKVTARNLFRYKGRMIMTIIGVMGCMALLVLGFGIKNSVNGIELIQFKDIQKYDLAVSYDREIDEDSYKAYKEKLKDLSIDYKEYYQENFKVDYKELDQDIGLIVPADKQDSDEYFRLRDRRSKKDLDLPERGAIISEKIAKIKGLKKGDSLEVRDIENQIYKIEIAGIAEMYSGHYMFMDRDYYTKLFGREFKANTDFMKIKDMNPQERERLSSKFTGYKAVLSAVDVSSLESIMDKFMYSISKVEFIIIVASSILAMVVLYNLTNINIEERIREISTIKVLGFYSKETTKYVYRESFILTLLGIIIGVFVGKILHYSVIKIVEPISMMFNPTLKISSYLIAGFITFILSIIVMLIFHIKLKNIDMIESLKSNE